ncbi:epoxide hydrolase family protein [Nonomuraea basaltis]|uniref:epoxide hydrolase family protein n=1 Tax=Nonomuraea basaltis TaxID=2495887 RepID=UPI00110C48AD|nr:epoxide hydrolase family protein [Nonomuraea basaltis]TMR89712.1 epoxide hydrolase [Nonomuraea basaltis]
MRPYRVEVPQSCLDDLAERLARTRFTRSLPGRGHGVPTERVRRLVERWREEFDWRAQEAAVNAHPQFVTEIDGVDVHFLHVRSPRPGAFPLILTHGWPMSVVEYLPLIGLLGDEFDLVIPSIPGFGFSAVPGEAGWNRRRTAGAWAELMRRLGYERYGVHGNDVGALISVELGRLDPRHVTGVHVTQIFSVPSGDPAELAALGPGDLVKVRTMQRFMDERGAYLKLQSTQPQTLAHALADSPAGQLAWSLQLFGESADDDYVLANATIHWVTDSGGSAALSGYHGNEQPPGPSSFPLGVACFAGDFFPTVRALAERDHTAIVHWSEFDRGGHHAAQEAPELLAGDIRAFFAARR